MRLNTEDWLDHIDEIRAGTSILLSGKILTGRDAAHKRLLECISSGLALPVSLTNRIIYYTGPCPAPPGWAIGPAGPTTSGRMDAYTPALLEAGLRGMLGKGLRSQTVKDAMIKHRAVYFAATGGAGALLARRIKRAEVVAYKDLGPEAIFELTVEDFPMVVAIDHTGRDLYREGVEKYRQ